MKTQIDLDIKWCARADETRTSLGPIGHQFSLSAGEYNDMEDRCIRLANELRKWEQLPELLADLLELPHNHWDGHVNRPLAVSSRLALLVKQRNIAREIFAQIVAVHPKWQELNP